MSDKMKYLFVLLFLFSPLVSYARCDYPDDRDSAGRRCGGRAASVIPGGRLGGDGRYKDSQGRDRIYGRGNDPYDRDYQSPRLITPRENNQRNSPFGL